MYGKKLALHIITFFLIPLSLYADISQYYPRFFLDALSNPQESDTSSREIKNILFKILSMPHLRRGAGHQDEILNQSNCPAGNPEQCLQHTSLGYREARKWLFGHLFLKRESTLFSIKDVYCSETFTNRTPKISTIGVMVYPNHEILNTEHTWPQSHFSTTFSPDFQLSDLHHLFPTEHQANNIRSNHPFGEVEYNKGDIGEALCDQSQFGTLKVIPEVSHHRRAAQYFEPPAFHRGNVARAMFYFSTRYQMKIDPIQEAYFRKWHQEDPADLEEIWRNDQIEKAQGNRNPFIDFPELADTITDF
jgi:deoxyribonuclease I